MMFTTLVCPVNVSILRTAIAFEIQLSRRFWRDQEYRGGDMMANHRGDAGARALLRLECLSDRV
jgi:hypothetical protein